MSSVAPLIPALHAARTLGRMETTPPHTPAPPAAADDPARVPTPFVPYDWDQAREDFLSGEPAVIVGARLQVSERTVTRRAAQEGWRRRDQERAAVPPPLDPTLSPTSPLDNRMLATEIERRELMDHPDPRRSIRHAYHRSNEAAVRGRPSEALAWARLIEVLDRVQQPVRLACGLASDADILRAIDLEARYARVAGQAEDEARWHAAHPDGEPEDEGA